MGFRKALHIILLVVFLLTSVTGWAAGKCCPQAGSGSEDGCVASDDCTFGTVSLVSPHEAPDPDSADRPDYCTCVTCQLSFLQAPSSDFQLPDRTERVCLIFAAAPPSTDLSDIFRPPLA